MHDLIVSRMTSSAQSRKELRERSKKLFGNADRLQVAFAVAESSGVVHAQEIADRLSISPPRVRTQLLAFVDSGVMQTLPRNGHTQNYERIQDPFWDMVTQLLEAWVPDSNMRSVLRPGLSTLADRSEAR
jgi:Fe2+ or Zn2+ uptake regulation protein